ncbi:conserved hypothetical protein [Beggiatoa sp. PS]|nr:conserved hypothetical protein [Beggiatoa sp. PS]
MLKHSTVPANCQAKNLEKAKDKLALMKMDKEERQRYQNYLMGMADEQSVLEAAKTEGEQIGEEKGKLKIAQKMQQAGMDIETIATITGLSPEVIKSLSKTSVA